jgi:hypothetical protein
MKVTQSQMSRTQQLDKLRIIPVRDRKSLRQFIRLPWSIYRSDPCWVPPLLFERKQHVSSHNPYFAHARWQAWLALCGARPVGRISAQVDQLYLQRYSDATGFFGMLEAEDASAIFQSLLNTAEIWLRGQGMDRVVGPFNFSINDECGLLIDGFDTPPSVKMAHGRAYYARRIEALGYAPAKDLLAYRLTERGFTAPEAMRALVSKKAGQVHLRPLDRSRLDVEFGILRDIFNDAWSENWGFVPFTEAEFAHIGRSLAPLLNDDFVRIAEVDDDPAAMIVIVSNLNEIIRDLDGRLLPWGWFKLFWRLRRGDLKTARIPLLGVRKRYQKSLLGIALAFMLIDAVYIPLFKRVTEVEMSWILEDNLKIRHIIEALGGVCYKRYRIYQKALG